MFLHPGVPAAFSPGNLSTSSSASSTLGSPDNDEYILSFETIDKMRRVSSYSSLNSLIGNVVALGEPVTSHQADARQAGQGRVDPTCLQKIALPSFLDDRQNEFPSETLVFFCWFRSSSCFLHFHHWLITVEFSPSCSIPLFDCVTDSLDLEISFVSMSLIRWYFGLLTHTHTP